MEEIRDTRLQVRVFHRHVPHRGKVGYTLTYPDCRGHRKCMQTDSAESGIIKSHLRVVGGTIMRHDCGSMAPARVMAVVMGIHNRDRRREMQEDGDYSDGIANYGRH